MKVNAIKITKVRADGNKLRTGKEYIVIINLLYTVSTCVVAI